MADLEKLLQQWGAGEREKRQARRIAELETERDSLQKQVDRHVEGAQKAAKDIADLIVRNNELREALVQLRTTDFNHPINRHIDEALNTPTPQEEANG